MARDVWRIGNRQIRHWQYLSKIDPALRRKNPELGTKKCIPKVYPAILASYHPLLC